MRTDRPTPVSPGAGYADTPIPRYVFPRLSAVSKTSRHTWPALERRALALRAPGVWTFGSRFSLRPGGTPGDTDGRMGVPA
jgi:hypothetical protein